MKRKKFFICVGIALCFFGGTLYVKKIHTATWQDAYAKTLQRGCTDDGVEFDSNYFALFDFDKNGTPELLLPGYKEKEIAERGFEYGSDICSQSYTIVSYVNGQTKVVFQDETIFIDMRYNPKNNQLLDWHPNGMGMPIITYQFNGKEFCELMSVYYSMEESGVNVIKYNNREEKTMEKWIDFEGEPLDAVAEESQCFKYYELSNDNIEKMCKGEVE